MRGLNSTQRDKRKQKLFKRQQGKCEGCRKSFAYDDLTLDHITPRIKGGGVGLDNLQLLCKPCNILKGAGTTAELRAKLHRQARKVRT